jgi:hypothetical protein
MAATGIELKKITIYVQDVLRPSSDKLAASICFLQA